MSLRDYQIEALEAVHAAMRAGVWSQVLVLPTGSGKTYVLAHLPIVFRDWFEAHGRGRMLILAHREELLQQAATHLAEINPSLRVGVEQGASRSGPFDDMVIASVQTLTAAGGRRLHALNAADFKIIVVDEAHHTPAITYQKVLRHFDVLPPESLQPKKGATAEAYAAARLALQQWWQAAPSQKLLLGVTATPNRSDGVGLEWSYQTLVYERSLRWMIERNYLVPPRGYLVETRTDLDDVHTVAGDFNIGELADAVNTPARNDLAVQAWRARARDRAGRVRPTLAFTADVQHAHDVAAAFLAHGVNAAAASGDDRAAVQAFRRGALDVIASAQLLTEGFDHPPAACALMMRPTKSQTLYCLDEETEIMTLGGWAGIGSVAVGDRVAAFDPNSGAVTWQPVTDYIERPLHATEHMYALAGPHFDLRVSDQHRLLWRDPRGDGAWRIETAETLSSGRASMWELPVAGNQDASGLPLTDAELRFVGWFVTDGNMNPANGTIRISQSRRYAAHIAAIDSCLTEARVQHRRYTVGPRATGFSDAYGQVTWVVSGGASTMLGWRGWEPLRDWLDKDLGRQFEDITREQLLILLEALHLGDGSKQTGQPWVRRTYHIGTARKSFADRLQSLCLRRGIRCNVTPDMQPLRGRPFWFVRARQDRDTWTVGGSNDTGHSRLLPSASRDGERIWCVENPVGTLITRRNGKAAVVGNCQMVGRVLRTAPAKLSALILDVCDVTRRHALVTAGDLFGLPVGFDAEGQSLVSVAQRVEAIQQRLPDAPIATAKTLAEIERRMQRVDLWTVRESDAVTAHAALTWVEDSPTVYHLGIPRKADTHGEITNKSDRLELRQNLLGGWKALFVDADTRAATSVATTDTLAQAFTRAEHWLEALRPDVVRMKAQDAAWRRRKASPKQIARLQQLGAGLNYETLTRGAASALLDQYFAARALSGARSPAPSSRCIRQAAGVDSATK